MINKANIYQKFFLVLFDLILIKSNWNTLKNIFFIKNLTNFWNEHLHFEKIDSRNLERVWVLKINSRSQKICSRSQALRVNLSRSKSFKILLSNIILLEIYFELTNKSMNNLELIILFSQFFKSRLYRYLYRFQFT